MVSTFFIHSKFIDSFHSGALAYERGASLSSQGVDVENAAAIHERNDSMGVDRKMSRFDKTRSGEFDPALTAFLRQRSYAEEGN